MQGETPPLSEKSANFLKSGSCAYQAQGGMLGAAISANRHRLAAETMAEAVGDVPGAPAGPVKPGLDQVQPEGGATSSAGMAWCG